MKMRRSMPPPYETGPAGLSQITPSGRAGVGARAYSEDDGGRGPPGQEADERDGGARGAADAAGRGPERGRPDRTQAGLDQDHRTDGTGVQGTHRAGEAGGPAHGLPGGRLPEHLRVLG